MHLTTARRKFVLSVLICTIGSGFAAAADARMPSAADSDSSSAELPLAAIRPVTPAPAEQPTSQIQWEQLSKSSFRFLAIMHGFRWLTEAGTRSAGAGLGSQYVRSIGNLHGWADGDPFYVNYVGHPMQGSVVARIFQMNDPLYRRVEFGKSPTYWKSRLRAAAFSWAFSEQFEIGPISEASIGHVQQRFPQQGFVDHVVTPTVGLGWTIAEDMLDRYVIKAVEARTRNSWTRLLVRSGLNPARSFAAVMDGKLPWYRDDRAGVWAYNPEDASTNYLAEAPVGVAERAPWEFMAGSGWRRFGGRSCAGGGANLAYRLSGQWQLALDVNGCKLLDLPKNLSGDVLVYQVGPRWSPNPAGRWTPFASLLVGGLKVTHEEFDPAGKVLADASNPLRIPSIANRLHSTYTRQEEADGVAVSAATGVDYRLNRALALRVASLEYMRSSIGDLGGYSYSNGLQLSAGLVLRIGTW